MSKKADGVANRVDPDQTASYGAVRSGSAIFDLTYQSQSFQIYGYDNATTQSGAKKF